MVSQHTAHALVLGGPLLLAGGMLLALHLSRPDRPVRTRPRRWTLRALALTWLTAAAVHASVSSQHFDESLVLGVFFVALAVGQTGYAAAILRRPGQRLLVIGAAGNVAVVLLWLCTRTVGLPFGLGAREGIGAADLGATAAEVIGAVLTVVILRGSPRRLPNVLELRHATHVPGSLPLPGGHQT
ncbi:MAG: hypothetical protein NVS3B26_29020 [Mycobacteriales bacterium]